MKQVGVFTVSFFVDIVFITNIDKTLDLSRCTFPHGQPHNSPKTKQFKIVSTNDKIRNSFHTFMPIEAKPASVADLTESKQMKKK